MIRIHNLTLAVVLFAIVEGIAIYLNMVAHPQSQPTLTIIIVAVIALIEGIYVWYSTKIK